jgi:hypothetical protein
MNIIPQEILLREHLVAASAWVREQLRRADIGSSFELSIEISGPIQTGAAKLVYKLDCSTNYQASVKGNSLADVTWELLRRMGWSKAHEGLAIEWNGAGAGAPSLEKEF